MSVTFIYLIVQKEVFFVMISGCFTHTAPLANIINWVRVLAQYFLRILDMCNLTVDSDMPSIRPNSLLLEPLINSSPSICCSRGVRWIFGCWFISVPF